MSSVRDDVERAFDRYVAPAVLVAGGAVLGRKIGKRVARRVTDGAKNASRKTHGDIRIRDDKHAKTMQGLVERAKRGGFADKLTRDYKAALARYKGGQFVGGAAGAVGGAGAGYGAERYRKKG